MSKECTVCYSPKKKSEFTPTTSRCKHPSNICTTCIKSHINTNRQKQREISCPDKDCKNTFELRDLIVHVPKKTIEEIEHSMTRKFIESMEEFRWCSTAACGNGQLVEGGLGENNFWRCRECNNLTCIVHRIQMHCGMTCEEYDLMVSNNPDLANEHYIQKNTKNCPSCNVSIEKNEGCDHMTCEKCQYEFCWLCMANFGPIRKEGNHCHKPSCAHYYAASEI